MSVNDITFLSPGVKTQESDESQIADPIAQLGPIIIGRTAKGRAGVPTRVNNLDTYNSVYGKPVDGSSGDDVWRNGPVGPTYASYAAHAWLASETTPVNMVRLLGEQDPTNPSGVTAGWDAGQAYGLFLMGADSRGVASPTTASAALAAVFYTSATDTTGSAITGAVTLSGSVVDESTSAVTASLAMVISGAGSLGVNDTIVLTDGLGKTATITIAGGTMPASFADGDFDTSVTNTATITLSVGSVNNANFTTTFSALVRALAAHSSFEFGMTAANVSSGTTVTLQAVTAGVEGNGATITCNNVGGTVAAILGGGSDGVARNLAGGIDPTSTGVGEVIEPVDADFEFVAQIQSNVLAGTKVKDIRFNFNRSSERYIRNVFNTDPTLTNNAITPVQDREIYWLGETFERHVKNLISDTAKSAVSGFILPLADVAGNKWSNHKEAFTYAHSGWFISQDNGTHSDFAYDASGVEKLFRCIARGGGQADNTAFYIGITDLKLPVNTNINAYGSFTLNVVEVGSNSVLESFSNLSFDKDSPNYIAKRIGDKYLTWVTTNGEGKYEEVGENANISSYIRIEMYSSSGRVSNKAALPFGFLGPVRPKATANIINSASAGSSDWVEEVDFATYGTGSQQSTFINHGGATNFSAKLEFPKLSLRISGSDGLVARPSRAYFGVRPTITATARQHDSDYIDYLRPIATAGAGHDYASATLLAANDAKYEYSFVFSLDNIRLASNTTTGWFYEDGSRIASSSYTAIHSVSALLDQGVKRFYAPMVGGSDGLDITEREPFRNALITNSSTKQNNYLFYTLDKALQAIEDPEVVPANLLLAPGIRVPSITDKIVSAAIERNDVLAIIDLEGDLTPAAERQDAVPSNAERGEVATAVTNLNARANMDSSYACAFYPAIQVADRETGKSLYVPSSVAGLGAMAQSQKAAELWFAPAGFSRGGLGNLGGRRGPTALQARQRLDSNQRDDLYAANINPIATFPNEGLVIFGQKTLQRANTALNRINVRRLMIFLRHQISQLSKGTLFEQNNSSTRSRLRNDINNILSDVQSRFGLSGYAIILDGTNNSADDIDNNRLNITIQVKPTRAIEFIAIDFIITRSGVELAE